MNAAAAIELHRLPTELLRSELRSRIARLPPAAGMPRIGHYAGVNLDRLESLLPAATTRAAVLIPIIDRGDDLTVLLTLRADDLKHHAGQISFPGGRLEAGDADATAAALRETEEEIGLRREYVEVLGCLPDHAVITGFRVTPVVGLVRLGFELVLDPTEVAGTFEAPLRHLLDPATHALAAPPHRGRGDRDLRPALGQLQYLGRDGRHAAHAARSPERPATHAD